MEEHTLETVTTPAAEKFPARCARLCHEQRTPLLAGFVGACAALVLFVAVAAAVFGSRLSFAELWGNDAAPEASDEYSVSGTAEGDSVVDVVARVNPAVVSIVATKDVPVMEQYYRNFGGFSIPQYRQNGTEQREVSSGSGFLISADGYIVTNQHVIDQEDALYTIFFNDGTEHEATVVALGDTYDIALLKIDGENLPYLEFGDSDALMQGQEVIAIGNALGEFRNTVSVGVVSGLSRTIVASRGQGESEILQDVIQTDAGINSGNSGGPLLDLNGFVVGVNVAMSAGAENIGFALPANDVKKAVDDMKEFGHIVRPYLGVRHITITDEIVRQNSLSVDHGALVVRGDRNALAVIPGSPADKAGIEENDIILRVDGVDVTVDAPLNTLLNDKSPGDSITLVVLHDGEEREVIATLAAAPETK